MANVQIDDIDDYWAEDDPDIELAKERTREKLYLLFLLAALYIVQAYKLSIDSEVIRRMAEEFAARRSDEMLTSIRTTALEYLRGVIGEGITTEQLAKTLDEAFLMSDAHVQLIALEAMIRGRNAGQVVAMALGGINYVYVTDGLDFDAPCIEANDTVRTIDWAKANPLQHPNCRRQFFPATPEQIQGQGMVN